VEKIVRVFESLEDADSADARAHAEMSGEELVENFFAIRERTHPDAFKQGLARVCRVLELEQS
jgi:hypothetical protein